MYLKVLMKGFSGGFDNKFSARNKLNVSVILHILIFITHY